MDFVGPTLSSSTITLASLPASTSLWQVGQLLDAVVVSLIGQDKVSLQIGNALLEARTSLAIAPGQRLSLEVVQSDKQIVLRIITAPSKADPMIAALRTALPQQLPLQTAFTRFAAILASSPGLPPVVTALLKQLLQQLPSDQTITRTNTPRQVFMDSGLFLEHKLSRNTQPVSLDKDIKANLLRLLAELTQGQGNSVADLTRHAEAALARIQLHQLATLAQDQPPLTWAGEIPVRHGNQIDVFQFRIEKDATHSAAADQQSWCTWLSFNLQTLGPLHAKITLTNKNIAAAFWAESNATADLVNEHLNYLHQTLEQAGLEVTDIQCRQGPPPFPPPDRLPKGLLDLTA